MFVYVTDKKSIIRIGVVALAIVAVLVILFVVIGSSGGGGSTPTVAVGDGTLTPIHRVVVEAKQVALSFDVAWGEPQVPAILDTLDTFEVKATFFVAGFWAKEHPDLVKLIAARGHEIASHSADHLHMAQLSREQIEADLTANNAIIKKLTGAAPTLFRPPFGEANDTLVRVALEQGMQTVNWSLDGYDWDGKTAEQVTRQIVKNVKAGDIVLLHVNNPAAAKALPDILTFLTGKDYQALTVGQLLLTGATVVGRDGVQRAA